MKLGVKIIKIALLILVSLGFSNALILKTITTDGNMADWSDILARTYLNEQVWWDFPYQVNGIPVADRDVANIQSTGRDIKRFACTWDANYFYGYLERNVSSTNQQTFVVYIDPDADGYMHTGDPVVLLTWSGSNRTVYEYLHDYNAVNNITGDPIVDPVTGTADGYTMPGTLSNQRNLGSYIWGSVSGTEMEFRVSWTNLGIQPPPSGVFGFHISSARGSASNVPSQVEDNAGPPYGPAFATQITIRGTIFEDFSELGVRDANDRYRSNVKVYLYKDLNNNGIPDNTELMDSTTTNGNGAYSFIVGSSDTFFIVVNSKTVSPSAGFNTGYGLPYVWAEQTYSGGGAWGGGLWDHDANPSTPPTVKNSAGACFGGRYGNRSDGLVGSNGSLNVSNAEHVILVNVQRSNIDSVDFGFSFEVVTNVNDQDDDLNNNRFSQGTLRQFIQNANAITGKNVMRFVPVVFTNESGGGGNWWKVTLNTSLGALPALTDNQTVVDGTAYHYSDGSTLRDENPGGISAPEPVGTGPDGVPGTGDETVLPQFEKPELEIDVNDRGVGIDFRASGCRVSHIGIFNNSTNLFYVRTGTNDTISDNFISVRADGRDPTLDYRGQYGVYVAANQQACILHNYIAYVNGTGCYIPGLAIVERNYLSHIALQSACGDGITFEGTTNVRDRNDAQANYNYIEYVASHGLESWQATGAYTWRQNTVRFTGQGDEHGNYCGQQPTNLELCGIRIFGDGSLVEHNVIHDAPGNAVAVVAVQTGTLRQPSRKNILSQNAFYNNGLLSIDLDQTHTDGSVNPNGDSVTANDGILNSNQQNYGIDYPIFTKVELRGSKLHVEGFVGTPSSHISDVFTIEVYKADHDGVQEGEIVQGDGLRVPHGEGHWYIGSCITQSDGTFNCDINVPSYITLTKDDSITATATNPNYGTSEFSANYGIVIANRIKGFVFEDQNHNLTMDNAERGIEGVRIELWYFDGTNWQEESFIESNSSGYFEFSPINTGIYRIIEDFNNNAGSNPEIGGDPPGYVSTTPNVQEVNWEASSDIYVYFGDYHGSRITGKVFYDAQNASLSTNNNGVYDTGERGINGVLVFAEASGNLIASTLTDNNGDYTLWIPYDVTPPFYLVEQNKPDYISTGDHDGGVSGNPMGADTVEFSTFSSGVVYSNYNFGDVMGIVFENDNSGSGMPGVPVYYPHIIISGTEGTISINQSSTQNWTWIFIEDVNKNGVLDNPDTIISPSFTLSPFDTMYIFVRAFIPQNATPGSMDISKFSLNFTFANQNSITDTGQVVDITTISGPLSLKKEVDKAQARPGDTVSYTIRFKNIGIADIDSIIITDPINPWVILVNGAFGVAKDIEFHYPDGVTVIYLRAEENEDTNSDGAWIMNINGSLFLRIDLYNLDSNSPGPIPVLKPGESSYFIYKVKIK
ncbi:MAG: hypothetical protein ACPLN0_06655 [Candidatus Hydrothermia bacterium]